VNDNAAAVILFVVLIPLSIYLQVRGHQRSIEHLTS
jgi:hypothetical protein